MMALTQAYLRSRCLAFVVTCATIVFVELSTAQAAAPLYAAEANDGLSYELNPTDGSLIGAKLSTLNGTPGSIFGFTGLATHPLTGELFALARISELRASARVSYD